MGWLLRQNWGQDESRLVWSSIHQRSIL